MFWFVLGRLPECIGIWKRIALVLSGQLGSYHGVTQWRDEHSLNYGNKYEITEYIWDIVTK